MKNNWRITTWLTFFMLLLCCGSVVSGTGHAQSGSNLNNQAARPMLTSHVAIPPRSQEIPIPADGDCLYKSIMMAYLLPVAKDKNLFNARLAMLIGQDTIIQAEEPKTDKSNENKGDNKGDSKINITQVWDAVQIRQNILNLRRSNLVYCLRQYPFPTLVPYMRSHIGIGNNVWGGTQEMQKIADKLQLTIEEYTPNPDDNSKRLTEPLSVQCKQGKPLLTLRIVRDNPTKEEAVDSAKDWQTQLIQYQSVKDAQHRQHYRALLMSIPDFLLTQNNLNFTTFAEGTNKDNQSKKSLNFIDDKVIQSMSIDNQHTIQKVQFTAAMHPLIVPAGKTVMLPSGILHRYSYIKLGRNATITTDRYNQDTQQGGRLAIYCYGVCILEEGARIHVNGCGHPGRLNGGGYGDGGGEGGIYCAGGGSYRTRGGTGKCMVDKQQHKALSGNTYGSVHLHIKGKLPLGSAGGAICFMTPKRSLPGARGGGALCITIDGTLKLCKKSGFQANGQDGNWSTGGAGSGGTLMLVCKGGIQMPDAPTNLLSVLGGQSLGRHRLARGSGGLGYSHLDYQYSIAPQIQLPHGLACLLSHWMRKSNIKGRPLLCGWITLFVGHSEQPTILVNNPKDNDEHFLDQLSREIAKDPFVGNKLQTLPNSKAVYIDYLYCAGQDAYQQKKYGPAIAYYQQTIANITHQSLHIKHGSSTITQKGCYINIAETYVAQGNYPQAVEAYKKAGQKAQSIEEALAQLERAQQKEIDMNYLTQQGLSLYIPLQAAYRPTDNLNEQTPSFPLADAITAFTGQRFIDEEHQDKDDEKKNVLTDEVTGALGDKGKILPNLRERLEQRQVLLLQGASGAGKSLAGWHMTTQYKGRRKDKKGTWVAVFISLPTTYGGADLFTKALMEKGLNLLTIHALQQSKAIRILFVLDGFDEIITPYRKHANLPDKIRERFGFDQWSSSKFIISFCSQGIADSDKSQYLGPHPEVHLIPFTQQQIKQYIATFAQNKALNMAAWNAKQYTKALAEYAGLTEMAREPFSLGLILNVLPYLNYKKVHNISRTQLYEAFVNQWFHRQISNRRENKNITMPTATLKQTFQTYCEELALAMFKRGQQVVDASEEREVSKVLFTQENRLSLQGSPLRKLSNSRYMFIHKSYQAYFVASRFIHNLLYLPKHQLQRKFCNFVRVDWNQRCYQDHFNDDAAVVGFMIDRLLGTDHRYHSLEKLLFALIAYSKQNRQVSVIAANSATLLCAARVPLSNQNWAGIHIPYAKLDQAFLPGTDFSHSDCTGVSLRQAYLERTRWQGAKVHDINFGELPYLQHDDVVNVAVYSPDGRYIASASLDKSVRVWDGQTSKSIAVCTGHTGDVYSVAWAQDNKRLASASNDNTVRIWDGTTGKPIAVCTGHTEYVNSVAWSRKNRIASASWDKTIRIWDGQTGKSIATCIGHSGGVNSVAWSQDSRRIVSASYDKTVRIWDAQNGETITICTGHTSYVYSAAWSYDNRKIASASFDNTVHIWDATTGKLIATCTGHTGAVLSVVWSQDNKIASASYDKTVRIWDSHRGKFIVTCTGHMEAVRSVVWSEDSCRIASASYDMTVRIWDATTGKSIATFYGHTARINSIAWSQDSGKVASASYDNTVRIWNGQNSKSITTCTGHSGYVYGVAWSQESARIASASWDNTVRIWNGQNGKSIVICTGHTSRVNSVAWSQDSCKIASASSDKTVRIWDAQTGKSIAICTGHTDGVNSVTWLQEKRIVSASWDRTVRIWDASTGKTIAICIGHTNFVTSVACSKHSGRIASASSDNTMRIWDGTTGKSIATCTGHTKRVTSVAWSRDSRRIASTSSDKTVRIWDASTGKTAITCIGHTGYVYSVAWSQDSRRIASASWDKTIRIWDASIGKLIATWTGHTSRVNSVAWARDNRIASASSDNTVRIWDTTTGHVVCIIGMEHATLSLTNAHFGGAIGLSHINKQLIQQRGGSTELLLKHKDSVTSAAWSQDGRKIASASADHMVRIWDASTGKTIAICTGHTDSVLRVSWTLDNRLIASAGRDNNVRIWDATTGKPITTCTGHAGCVYSIAWSRDSGKIASASGDNSVRIWDAKTGKNIVICIGHIGPVLSVAWSQDNRIASASKDNTVHIWNTTTGRTIATCYGHTGSVWSVAWSKDNRKVASASNDNTVRIWDGQNGEPIAICKGHNWYVNSVAWAQDSIRIASASYDKTVRIWDATTGKPIATCYGHTDTVWCVAWAQDGCRIASASYDKSVRIWDATTGKSIITCTGHTGSVTSVVWDQNDRIASASWDNTVRIWNVNERIMQQQGGSIEDEKNTAPKDTTTHKLDDEKK